MTPETCGAAELVQQKELVQLPPVFVVVWKGNTDYNKQSQIYPSLQRKLSWVSG